jgi:hypothetical protein
MWPSREELLQLMGMDDTQSRDASYLQDLLSTPAATYARYRRQGYQGRTHRLLLRRTIDVSIYLPDGYRPLLRREMKDSLVPRMEGQSPNLQLSANQF